MNGKLKHGDEDIPWSLRHSPTGVFIDAAGLRALMVRKVVAMKQKLVARIAPEGYQDAKGFHFK